MNAKTDDVKAGGKGKDVGKGTASDPKTGASASTQTPPDAGATAGVVDVPSQYPNTSAAQDAPPVEEGTGELVQAEKRLSPRVVMEQSISDMIIPAKAGEAPVLTLPCVLYTLIGTATGMRTGETDHGFWTAAVGNFEARRALDGKIFQGTEAHVPGAAGELLTIELRRLITEEEPQTEEEKKRKTKRYKPNGNSVDVAVMVGIKKASRAGGQPYEFTVQSIQQMRRSDPLAQLRAKAMNAFAALPAAVKPAAPALPAPDATKT